jgi:hypothetical protein
MAGEGVGRCILVGLHMDAAGKDVLQWALNQAARSGDRVVAVHIYRKSGRYRTCPILSIHQESGSSCSWIHSHIHLHISPIQVLLTSLGIFFTGDLCKTNALTLIRTLDEYLAEYEAICSKKDVSIRGVALCVCLLLMMEWTYAPAMVSVTVVFTCWY